VLQTGNRWFKIVKRTFPSVSQSSQSDVLDLLVNSKKVNISKLLCHDMKYSANGDHTSFLICNALVISFDDIATSRLIVKRNT